MPLSIFDCKKIYTQQNIIKPCVFVQVGPEIITMGCPNLVQTQT